MNAEMGLGFLLVVIGGVMEGAFSLPLKFTPRWRWEHTWGAGSLAALIAVPWPLALSTVPDLIDVYRAAPSSSIALALLFGAGWGVGGIFFGLGLARVGLSVGLTLIMGLIAIGGSIVPLLVDRRDQVFAPAGLLLLVGIVVMIAGLRVSAAAGALKEGPSRQRADAPAESFHSGVLLCVAAGLLSSLVNFALIFGRGISDEAVARGVPAAQATNAVWALVFTANYAVNVGYCVWLMVRRGTLSTLAAGAPAYWLGALVMGLLWAGGIVIYGMGALRLGALGAYLGFPVMLIVSILTGHVLGALTGEWRGAPARARRVMLGGVGLLACAVWILAYGGTVAQ